MLTIFSAAPALALSGARNYFASSIKAITSDPHVHMVRQTLTTSESNAILQFSISLKMRNFEELEARIANGEQIPPGAMATRYLPSASDYAAVKTWLKGQGLTLLMEDPNHTNIFVCGTVAQIQRCLGVNFVRVATADGQFTSAISAPSLPVEFSGPVLAFNGLQPHLQMHRFGNNLVPDRIANTYFLPSEILAAYSAPSTLDGTGQTIAIIMDSPVRTSDLTSFYSTVGSTAKASNFTTIPVNGGTTSTADADEASMDVEWAGAMAPGAKIRFYEVPDLGFSSLAAACTQILADASANHITVMSFSAGSPEVASGLTASSLMSNTQAFAQMATAGISVFISSGDGGSNPDTGSGNGYVAADSLEVDYPASDVNVTGVGGTELTFGGNGVASYAGETPFSQIASGVGFASGGGVSAIFTKPTWQTDGVSGSILSKNTNRCVPDVSIVWDAVQQGNIENALVVLNGTDVAGGGTSLSTPIWAGVTALINQARASVGGTPIGLLGPVVYPLDITSPAVFHDITTGNNGFYSAGTGYDLCSGLGSPNIANLVSPLAAVFPIITQQPQSVTVNAGSSFNLIVQATSSASNNSNLSYQWFKDGVAKDGFTTQNYFIFSATAADAGSYTVAVTDSLGTATSNPAVVTVNPAPAPPSSGGGGGAPSYWFYLALAVLLAIRKGLGTKKRDCAIQSR